MSTEDQTVPDMDHGDGSGEMSEQALLDAVMANSPLMQEVGGAPEPLPEEQDEVLDEAESDEEEYDQEESEEAAEEELEEEVEETEGEDAPEGATEEPDVYAADDLDLEAKVRVKIDGEEMDVSFEDLLKGYQTDASLSKKGRELGDAKKALEEEREQALAQVNELGQASAAVLMGQEQNLSKEYHDIEAKIEKAREEGDTYEVGELKDKREQVQKKYWNARKQREGLQAKLKEQQEAVQQEAWRKQIEYFQDNIESFVPGFDETVAKEIRDFAVGEGLPEVVVDNITDPAVVKVLNDYRVLKQGVKKGEAKRKAVPAKKSVPAKKAKTAAKKKQDADKMVKARAFKEDASQEDQMAFLRQYAAKSLGS
ncbi:MAG: hypothetical protein GDA45_07370 [Chromatiales bacterium]|nr:hypothetical protein [Chromatiales bacterium]